MSLSIILGVIRKTEHYLYKNTKACRTKSAENVFTLSLIFQLVLLIDVKVPLL